MRTRISDSQLPLPPYRLMEFTGGPGYDEIGKEFFDYLREMAKLQANDSILDIGSGCGRIAAPLTTYLTKGSYSGFDISSEAVKWCQQVISARFPNFHFQMADVYNGCYNRLGSIQPGAFRFPYPDGTFDVAAAVSVFTHLIPEDTAHYLSEIKRILKPSGRLLATFFLLTEKSPHLLERRFTHPVKFGASVSEQSPEEAIAISPDYLEEQLSLNGFSNLCLERGQWHIGSSGLTFQDLLVCRR